MVVFNINHLDYSVLLKDISTRYNIPFTSKNHLSLPPAIGNGYLKTLQLQNGLQVMLVDIVLKKSFITVREQNNNRAFVLHFDDLLVKGAANYFVDKDSLQKTDTRITVARLTCNMFVNTEELPPLVKFKSIKILFDEKWLKKYLGLSSNTAVLKTYLALKTASFEMEPLDADYLLLMDEIWNVKSDDPLQEFFLQNRIDLLMERFFTRLHCKSKLLPDKINLTDDEIERMVKIENILREDFRCVPPTIDEFCKIVSMSKTKLKISFKKVYGSSIYAYHQQLRMQKAKKNLETGILSISETAKAIGYQKVANFVVAFQKHFLQLPSAIKKT